MCSSVVVDLPVVMEKCMAGLQAEEDGLSNQEGVPSSMMPALEDEDGPAWVFVVCILHKQTTPLFNLFGCFPFAV